VLVAASAIFWKTSKYAAMAWMVALKHQNTELGSKLRATNTFTQTTAVFQHVNLLPSHQELTRLTDLQVGHEVA
jgi:hypothetical protein